MSDKEKSKNHQNSQGVRGGQGTEDNEQLSLFDLLNEALKDADSKKILDAIDRLQNAWKVADDKEREEKRRKEQLAREEKQRREQLEKERIAREKEKVARENRIAEQKHVQEVTSMELPMDWENAFCSDDRAKGVYADSPSDGLILSLSNLGRVDIEYISAICGQDYKSVIAALRGSIYQNPAKWDECFYKGWETSDEYLSGNLINKHRIASAANKKYKGYFANNVKAIESVMPEKISSDEIYVTLGSPWVPSDVIDSFIIHLFGAKTAYRYPVNGRYLTNAASINLLKVKHDELTGSWEVPSKNRYGDSVAITKTWGTYRMPALQLIEKALNMQVPTVKDEVSCATNASGKTRVVNQAETISAIEKQQKIIKEFQRWVWTDEKRKKRLLNIYEEKFACVRQRIFNGSYLTFPTMDKSVKLYPYQKDAVARILYSPNTLLAHDVGSGKTYVMIAAGMELKRMGLSQKNLYVVPNNIVGQWETIFKTMYPNANVLCVSSKDFVPSKRQAVLERIRDNDFDGIVMAYSCFELITLSKQYHIDALDEVKQSIVSAISDEQKSTARLKKKLERVEEALGELLSVSANLNEICFDELGITRLFVDEAHNYKNLEFETKMSNVLGISSSHSKKCKNMLDKVRYVQKNNNGGGVVMATGTPITNSITDAYVMQTYLQSGQLAMLELQSFDSWVGMFAEQKTEFEVDVDTSKYRLATRFSSFHNLPELTTLLSSIADFHSVDKSDGIPDFDGYTDALVPKTPDFANYLKEISQRADDVRANRVSRTTDNMLKITTDGRKAALELRLVLPNASFTFQSKVARCAENVADIYLSTQRERLTQLVFCDTSTPKQAFNVYDELKSILVRMGVQEDEIAFVHDYETETRRASLFAKMRSGQIRILLGSTFKLGLGVNIQDRLYAIHHLDVPWRPADMVQREGRILRQGNLNKKVKIFRYITEGSFDAYSWQLLETKQRFICDLLSGSLQQRSGSDIDDVVLNYAEVKALAVGNPLIKERVETANELTKYMTLQRKYVESRISMQKELDKMPAVIKESKLQLENCKKDIEQYESQKREHDKTERAYIREKIHSALCENVFATGERTVLSYNGFDVVLPANMLPESRYVYLVCNGKYRVDIGDSALGVLVRIDNFLENLSDRKQLAVDRINENKNRRNALIAELAKEEVYTVKIDELKSKLEKIDRKLGVKIS